MMGPKSKVEGRFKEIKIGIGTSVRKMRSEKTIKTGLSGVEVAPFGPKLCQIVAPRLMIIFQALPGPKNKLKKNINPENVENPDSPRSKSSIIC